MPPQTKNFIYIIGEEQSAVLTEDPGVLVFTQASMAQIATQELESVIVNVFARGQFFPGPNEALTAVIHEYAGRTKPVRLSPPSPARPHCTVISAFRLLNGEIAIKNLAFDLPGSSVLDPQSPDGFYSLFLDFLPSFKEVFAGEAWAPNSKLIEIIQNASTHHYRKGPPVGPS